MKIAYFDCLSGISGDMTLGALVDVGVPLESLNRAVQSLALPGLRLTAKEVRKKGFRATQVVVEHEHEHAHRHLSDIVSLMDRAELTPRQREVASRIFTRLADAEAKVHGTTREEVHFHEVGAADSIADIVGAAVGLDLLGVQRVVASAIPTGSGQVRIAHGLCSVPAPATAELLQGLPLAASNVQFELTTPTGAAILATLADGFGPVPAMRLEKTGYGAGTRDLVEQPNVLRLLIGEALIAPSDTESERAEEEPVWIVETNVDDAPGEMIGYCIERLWETEALDVWTTPIQMKKQRPGVRLTVLCRETTLDAVETILLEETTTLGIRRWPVGRHVLPREAVTVQTAWGPISGKVATLPDGRTRFAPEYEACRVVAREAGVPLRDVYEAARGAHSF